MTVLTEVYRPGVVLRCDLSQRSLWIIASSVRIVYSNTSSPLFFAGFGRKLSGNLQEKCGEGGGEAGQTPVSTQRAHGHAEYTQRRHNYWRELPAHLLTHWAEVERWRTRRRLLIRSLQETSVSQILTGMWSPASLCSAEKRKTFLLNQQTFTSENSRYWKWYHSIWSVEPAVLMK